MEPTYSEAHILMAQIHLHDGKHRLAGQALEQAMSLDFAVRESPQFLIMRGKVLTAVGELEEAQKVLEQALALPGVKGEMSKAAAARKAAPVTLGERVSIFMLLAEVHTKLDHLPEAAKVISDAQHLFRGTAEEVRVTIANCELALGRGDVDGALAMLRVVPQESPHFLKAKMATADIYLRKRNDKRMFAQCYQELVDLHPDPQTFMMLGEAYMQIQEPERAVESYERALRASPRDVSLQQKIGQALVMTHDYQKAVDYYEAAVRADGNQVSMQQDLAELYYKLRQFAHAHRVLDALVERRGNLEDAGSMQAVVGFPRPCVQKNDPC
jgi:tetratricopeptide repeat protein 21B